MPGAAIAGQGVRSARRCLRPCSPSAPSVTTPSSSLNSRSPGRNVTSPNVTGTSTSPSPAFPDARGDEPMALMPTSRPESAAASRTQPWMMMPAQPLSRASVATSSPVRATRREPPPSTTRTAPFPGSERRRFSTTLSSSQRTVLIGPWNARRPPYCRSSTVQTDARSPYSSRMSAVAVMAGDASSSVVAPGRPRARPVPFR